MAGAPASVWSGVVGQDRAVARLRRSAADPVHAYLFVGPPGSTKDAAARAFAAHVLAGDDDPAHRDARLALAGQHPDVREVRRVGASLSVGQVDDVVRLAALAPVEARRTVLVIDEAHLLLDVAAGKLLKTIEEPPPATMFVVLADHVPTELVTIASRCVRIDFGPVPTERIAAQLVAEGHEPALAEEAAAAAAGNLERARVLVGDSGLTARRRAFASVPRRLDGTGATVAALADEVVRMADEAAAFLAPLHETELAELEARVAAAGERGSGRKELEDRHKREVRRYRTDELRSGLAAMAGTYRDALADGTTVRTDGAVRAVGRIHQALEALERNPNEALLLQALLLELPAV